MPSRRRILLSVRASRRPHARAIHDQYLILALFTVGLQPGVAPAALFHKIGAHLTSYSSHPPPLWQRASKLLPKKVRKGRSVQSSCPTESPASVARSDWFGPGKRGQGLLARPVASPPPKFIRAPPDSRSVVSSFQGELLSTTTTHLDPGSNQTAIAPCSIPLSSRSLRRPP